MCCAGKPHSKYVQSAKRCQSRKVLARTTGNTAQITRPGPAAQLVARQLIGPARRSECRRTPANCAKQRKRDQAAFIFAGAIGRGLANISRRFPAPGCASVPGFPVCTVEALERVPIRDQEERFPDQDFTFPYSEKRFPVRIRYFPAGKAISLLGFHISLNGRAASVSGFGISLQRKRFPCPDFTFPAWKSNFLVRILLFLIRKIDFLIADVAPRHDTCTAASKCPDPDCGCEITSCRSRFPARRRFSARCGEAESSANPQTRHYMQRRFALDLFSWLPSGGSANGCRKPKAGLVHYAARRDAARLHSARCFSISS